MGIKPDFVTWLLKELDNRGWNYSDLARQSGLSPGAIGNVARRTRNPGPDFCESIAKALGYPPETVYRAAGLLPEKPAEDPLLKRANYLLSNLPTETQREIMDYIEYRYQKNRNKDEDNPSPRLADSHP